MASERVEQQPSTLEKGQSVKLPGLTTLQGQFLLRLEQLVKRRAEYLDRPEAEQDKFELNLLSRGVYTALKDCVSTGVGDQANAVIEAEQPQGS